MKKNKIISLALATLFIFTTACSNDSSTDNISSTNKPDEKALDVTVVEVWTNDRHDSEYVETSIEKYNETNTDNIKINLTVVTDNYANMLSLAYTGGTAPDIAGVPPDIQPFVEAGIFEPLNQYIDSDVEFQKVNEPYENAFEGYNLIEGNLYSVPTGMRSGVRVQYNEDLLNKLGYSEVPKDFEDYINMAKDITNNGAGQYYGIGFTSSSPVERLLEPVAQVSGVYHYDYINGRYDFSGYKEIVELMQRFVNEEIVYPDQQGVDNMRALFAQGEFALWSNASQEAGVFTSQIPITEFEWGVAPVPSLNGEIRGALEVKPSKAYAMFSSSTKKDEAWKVIQFFQSEEFIKGYLEAGYCLPITSYMDERIDKSKTGRLADFGMLEYESVYPVPPMINLTGDSYRTQLWNATMGYMDIDEAIEDLNKRYNEALDADVAAGNVKRLVIKDYDPLYPTEGEPQYLTK